MTIVLSQPHILEDGESLSGDGVGRTWVQADPSLHDPAGALILPERYAECLAEDPRANWQRNMTAKERPRWCCEVRDLGIDGRQQISDFPSTVDAGKPDVLNGLRLYEGGHRAERLLITKFAGTGLTISGGSDARRGEKQREDIEEMLLRDIKINQCYTGLWSESGSDNEFFNLNVCLCRDVGIRVWNSATSFHTCHIYGMDRGIVLEHNHWEGPTFTGRCEIESCWVCALDVQTHVSTVFEYLLIHSCPGGAHSVQDFRCGIDAHKSILTSRLLYKDGTHLGYSLQSRGNGSRIMQAQFNSKDPDCWHIYHNAHDCDYDLKYSDTTMACGMAFVGGMYNRVESATWMREPMLRIYGGDHNRFTTGRGLVQVGMSKDEFERRGNCLDAVGTSVEWDAILPPPPDPK